MSIASDARIDVDHKVAWGWMLAVFFWSSPRLFENGISLDPALYAVVSRNLAVDNDWWSLKFGETLFPQFFEQPFLVFWLQSLVFKTLGVADYTTRLLGLLFGSGSFYFLYRIGEMFAGRWVASILCLLCFLDINFTGRFATLYLEVPLTFFTLGGLFLFLTSLSRASWWRALAAGLLFSGACLTKGFAALPTLGTLTIAGVIICGWKTIFRRESWISLIVSLAVVAAFCGLQARFGKYPFASLYFENTFLKRTLEVGSVVGPWPFLQKFFTLAAVPLLLSCISMWRIMSQDANATLFAIGAAGTVFFTSAGAFLGFPYLHYYHGLFPFLYMMAAPGAACLLSRFERVSWIRVGICLGLLTHVFWNLVPFPMRRKPADDFFQLRPLMREFSKAGTSLIETVGIDDSDWSYRQFSYWYWGLDSRLRKTTGEVELPIVLSIKSTSTALESLGYVYCDGSRRYDVWVRGGKLQQTCRENPFDMTGVR